MRTSAPSLTTFGGRRCDEAASERLILIYGNCQGHYLAAVLAAQGLGMVCVVGDPYGFYPEVRGIRPPFISWEEAAWLATYAKAEGRQVALLEQTAPLLPGLDPWAHGLAGLVVRFPYLELRAYWHPWLSKVGDPFDPDRIRRQFEFDLAAMRRSEAGAGWNSDLTDHLVATHRQVPLFYTSNHPTADLFQRLHARICTDLAGQAPLDPVMSEWAQSEIAAMGGLGFICEHPLHDAVIDALDLQWAREGWYALWQRGYSVTAAGKLESARSLLMRAIEDPGHDPHVQATLGNVLSKLGDRAGAARAFGAAHRAYPQNPEYAKAWLAHFVADDQKLSARIWEEFAARSPRPKPESAAGDA